MLVVSCCGSMLSHPFGGQPFLQALWRPGSMHHTMLALCRRALPLYWTTARQQLVWLTFQRSALQLPVTTCAATPLSSSLLCAQSSGNLCKVP